MMEDAALVIARLTLTVARFFAYVVFDVGCGYIGHYAVRGVTLDRVRLDPLRGHESLLASFFGVVIILICGALGAFVLRT